MAEEPIRKEDIIDEAGILASIQTIIDGLKTLIDTQMKAVVTMREAAKGMNPATPEGQSGIKQVSADIDDAAPKIKALNDLTKELTRRQEELAASTGKSNKEFRDDTKALVSAQKALQGTFQETKSVEGSINKLKEELKKLTKEYNNMDAVSRGKAAPGIKKLTDELKKAESAIGNNTRNVGNYSSALSGMGTKIMDSIKSFSIYAVAVKFATDVFAKLKEAFMSTVEGMNIMNVVGAASKQMFYDLATTGKVSYDNMKNAAEAAKVMNNIRAGDRADMVEFAKLEREITKLEFDAADKTKTNAEQKEALNKAIEKQNILSDKRIADAWEELQAIEQTLAKQPRNEELLNKQAELKAKIIGLDDQRFSSMRRNEARATAFEKAEAERIENQYTALMKAADDEIQLLNDKDAKIKAASDKERKEIIDSEVKLWGRQSKLIGEKGEERLTQFELLQKRMVDKDKETGDQLVAANKDVNDKKIKQEQEATDITIEIQQRKAQLYQDITAATFNFISAFVESNKQKELDAAGDNAEEKIKIEREYAKKEKALSISQAIIATSLAVLNALNTKPYLPLGPLMAISAAALGAIQIATIAATKFAEGGEVGGRPHSQGGTMIEAERGEYVISKTPTSKYKGLIEAINEDNPMRIAEEIRNRNFHTVWGGVSQQLSQSTRQDPYTRLTYELLKKRPEVYTDSNGDTNLVYPDGSRKVIRKYQS